ncbi:hypothetical protein SAMN02745673_03200 [Marinactinospora thermotolerans DSM 45154]|uniref:Uncharacterized protein n=1 Tax=Marinactinospora thermotolerans DSM 45154 TaxID=1122192 RepID=A0A1T4S5B3_9ACTN|nr:hypothetical protein [Marinactinospora thermotolerans]SKA23306.1 hypothetical protein SAMN02745673_03200 [Marinactinospora thermotolerans DSM 45154]
MLAVEPGLTSARPGQTPAGDKDHFGHPFEGRLTERDIRLPKPTRDSEPEWPGAPLSGPSRQVVEPVDETFTGHLGLGRRPHQAA